jgi:AcrR family transcriptional regulator
LRGKDKQVRSRHNVTGRKTKERILKTAISLTAELGFTGWTLQMLAGRIGITAPNVLLYWLDTDELKSEVFRECVERLSEVDGIAPADVVKCYVTRPETLEEERAVLMAASFLPQDTINRWEEWYGAD